MNSYEKIAKALSKYYEEGWPQINFSLDISEESTHGNYSTNIAFPLSKIKQLYPMVCAEELKKELEKDLFDIVEKIEVVSPGFINFFLKDDVIREENEKENVGIITNYTGQNILVEHSSPNLFKPFSVGHLLNNIIGEFVFRAMKEGGANVKNMSFPSDVSLGVAEAIFIIERDIKDGKIKINDFRKENEDVIMKYLGDAYVKGVNECEENENSLNEAKKVLDKLYNLQDDYFYKLVSKIREINTDYFKKILFGLGTDMGGRFLYESRAGAEGVRIVKENLIKIFKEGENGAIIYTPSENRKDINTAVFINNQGYPTYEAKDLGLLFIKFKSRLSEIGINNFYPDFSYVVTDNEQIQHFKVVLDAASKINNEWMEWAKRSFHITHGRMLFKGKKMSSRLGGVPLAVDVIKTVEEEVENKMLANLSFFKKIILLFKINILNPQDFIREKKEIALSAIRIAVLRSKPGININFDPATSLSFEGDSGPYLLYTHARCNSLMERAKEVVPLWGNYEVTDLEKRLIHFEKVLEQTINDIAPQKLTTYLFNIAQLFNTYYAQEQIIVSYTGEDDKRGNAHRLKIVKRTKHVLQRGLLVLGITAPEKM